jgi:hypothetical protein
MCLGCWAWISPSVGGFWVSGLLGGRRPSQKDSMSSGIWLFVLGEAFEPCGSRAVIGLGLSCFRYQEGG